MKEKRYFRNKDIRALESPYEASFELAEIFGRLSRSLKWNLKILIIIFLYYSAVIIGVIVFNILYGTNVKLNMFSVAFSIFMLYLTVYSLKLLFESHTFLTDLRFNQELMMKIKKRTEEGDFDIVDKKELRTKDDPIKGLINLIESTSRYSKNITSAFKLIVGFIAVWYIAGIIFFSIQVYRFGLEIDRWTLDWLLPGGIDISVAVIATILILLVRDKFEFARKRYEAIEYAMSLTPIEIPEGDDPVRRYIEYLMGQTGYEQLKAGGSLKKGPYFDAELHTAGGAVFVKYLKNTPKIADIKKFKERVIENAVNDRLDRAVIIFKEDPKTLLSDEVYHRVLEEPVKLKKDICSIQLVIEGKDKKYDFIPVVSF